MRRNTEIKFQCLVAHQNFCGSFITLYSKFRPSVSLEVQILYELQKKKEFAPIWDKSHKHAFEDFKMY